MIKMTIENVYAIFIIIFGTWHSDHHTQICNDVYSYIIIQVYYIDIILYTYYTASTLNIIYYISISVQLRYVLHAHLNYNSLFQNII